MNRPSRQAKSVPFMEIETDPGYGNLSAKAYMAAVIGPYRVASGAAKAIDVGENKPVQLVQNSGVSEQCCFVSVSLPANGSGTSTLAFGNSNSLGFASGMPAEIGATFGPLAGRSFGMVLLPGDSLYAVTAPGEGTIKVVVRTVWF